MSAHNLFLVLSVLYMGHLTRHVSALNAEEIANGAIVNQTDFQNQVAIFGRSSPKSKNELLGNGVIVASSWILSIAHLFMETSDHILDLLFTAVVGSSGYGALNGVSVDIVYIYTYDYNYYYRSNDIVMAKTKHDLSTLSITFNEILVPKKFEQFIYKDGKVSGYGTSAFINKVKNGVDSLHHVLPDQKLRQTSVKFFPIFTCEDNFRFIATTNKFCGVASFIEDQYTGMCWNDAGSPLILNGKVVGLSSSHYHNCNDTKHGSLYVQTWDYYEFIINAKNDNQMYSMSKHFTLNSQFQ